ncbi:MAG: hypothetical protein GY807_01605 [Gammaproteobacteria bacterium]|nr:hypothetical protein [Gammaproteobacteria bacterium]
MRVWTKGRCSTLDINTKVTGGPELPIDVFFPCQGNGARERKFGTYLGEAWPFLARRDEEQRRQGGSGPAKDGILAAQQIEQFIGSGDGELDSAAIANALEALDTHTHGE